MFDDQTKSKIAELSTKLAVPTAALLAVAEVESGGQVFARVQGRDEPIIRFEGHYFDRLLPSDARLEARSAGLAHPESGKIANPRGQVGRWKLLQRAIRINRVAALSSVSWGIGQVMGAHWRWLGYGSVDALVAEVRSGGAGQIALMARYIDKAGLIEALQQRNWAEFARAYNGPAYKRLAYDDRLEKAYQRWAKETDFPNLPTATLVGDKNSDKDRLSFGSRGPAVKRLQRSMTRLGYVLVADGLFGLVTDRVVRQFQRDHAMDETGIVDRRERELIFGRNAQWNRSIRRNLPAGVRGWKMLPTLLVRKFMAEKSRLKCAIARRLLSISKRFA